jgi:hypothetical protein
VRALVRRFCASPLRFNQPAYNLMATGNAVLGNAGRYFVAPIDNRMRLCGLSSFHGPSVYTLIGTVTTGQRSGLFVAC